MQRDRAGTTTYTINGTGETFTVDDLGIVCEPATGDLTVYRVGSDRQGVLRVSRRGTDLGRIELWGDGQWHAGTGVELRPLDTAATLAGAVALFHAFRLQMWTPARGCETA